MDERVLKGRYCLLEVIGRGGVATVYRAWDVMAGRDVAVKILKEEYTEHPEFPERFRREAETVLHLNHPHIVGFLDYGVENGQHFLVMEYVEGETLARMVQERGALPIEQALDIARQVCEALEAAHGSGVVHRDIKPQNLMWMPDGTVKVMDFGLARVATEVTLTQTGIFMGTPRYVSPEVVKGERVDHRSDLYSLGIVLYEMLTGDIPFSSESTWALLQSHVQETPPPVREARPEVPEWLDRVVAKALAKDPDERFQSAAEFRAALQPPEPEVQSAPAPAPRRGVPALPAGYDWRWVAGAAFGVVLLLSLTALGMAGAGWFARPTRSALGGRAATTSPAPTATPTAGTPLAVVPPPTASPTVTATSTRTAPPTPTPTRTASPTPTATATPMPSPTATATPTRQPTPTPTPRILPQPTPLQPAQGAVWQAPRQEFAWAWEGQLGPGEFFELRVLPAGGDPEAPWHRAWSAEPRMPVDLTPLPAGEYLWGVWVVRGVPAGEQVDVMEVLQAPRDLWSFRWEPPTPTPVPPRPRLTDTPTPRPTRPRPTDTPTPRPTKPRPPTPTPPPPTNTPRPTATPRGTPIPFTPPPPKRTATPPPPGER